MRNNNTTQKYLGPKETNVLARLSYEKLNVFTQEQFDSLFKFSPKMRNEILSRLKRKGLLKSIKRGVYLYSPLESGPAGININEFLIPPILFPKGNYYIGYSTMYNYYGFTDQIFQTMFILNTSLQRERIIGGIKFKILKIPPNRFYGIQTININNVSVNVSDKERTLIDLIYYNKPVGGLQKAFEIISEQLNQNKTDLKKLIEYIIQFPNISTRKRLGYIIEKNLPNKKEINLIAKSIVNSSLSTLYPARSRKGKINKKWRLIENAP
ncbi:MAG: hypothetical protein KKH98_14720 [Spirochaetes bacterium]|nr:hypothetical protein [Spirochaetota bacterium]